MPKRSTETKIITMMLFTFDSLAVFIGRTLDYIITHADLQMQVVGNARHRDPRSPRPSARDDRVAVSLGGTEQSEAIPLEILFELVENPPPRHCERT